MEQKKEMPLIQNLDNFPLLSNQHTVVHQPDKFVIDFKGIYPQFTPDQKPQMIAVHKVVLLEPHTAKDFIKTLTENVKKYEAKYGKIKVPAAVEKAQKEGKKKAKSMSKSKSKTKFDAERPVYTG